MPELAARLQHYQREHQQQEQQHHHFPVSLVILLAGTNDLGVGFDADEIADNLVRLHDTCLVANGVPRTIAIGIPPSGYQSAVPAAAALAQAVNDRLRAYCKERQQESSSFVEFPFAYEHRGTHWDGDGLHLSAQGYQVLGESLVPTVQAILQSLEKKDVFVPSSSTS